MEIDARDTRKKSKHKQPQGGRDTVPEAWSALTTKLCLDVAGVMFVALDCSGHVRLVNKKGCDILGYTSEEMLGKDWFIHFIAEDQRSAVQAQFEALVSGEGVPFEYAENPVVTATGAERLIRWHNAVMRDDEGRIIGTLSSGEDITEQQHAVAALRRSEQNFRRLFEASPDAIFVEDLSGTVLDANPAACRLHSVASENLVGMNVRDLVPPEQRAAAMRDFEKLVRGDVSYLQAYSWTINQHAVPVEIRANPITYNGQPAILLIVRDLSERMEAATALEESEAKAQAIMNTTVDAILTIDTDGIIETVNPAMERIFGYTAEEMIGQNISLLMPLPYCDEHDQYIQRYLDTGKKHIIGIGREVVARRRDGATFPADLSVSEVRLGDRRIFTGFIRDISDRRHLEHEVLRISEEERQRIGRDLHDGLGSLLTGVAMGAQGLAQARKRGVPVETEDLEQLAQMVEEGAAQAQALSRGLNPVKLDAEGLPVALRDLVSNTSVLTKIACTFESDAALPPLKSLVATQLYWIAQEALNNAAKHAEATQIAVRLWVDKDDLVLTVLDDGTGLPDDPRSRAGTGLHIMPYRANLIGASYSIGRGPEGHGTLITCRLSLGHASQHPHY